MNGVEHQQILHIIVIFDYRRRERRFARGGLFRCDQGSGNCVADPHKQFIVDESVGECSYSSGKDPEFTNVAVLDPTGNFIYAEPVDQVDPDCRTRSRKTIVLTGVQIDDNDLFVERLIDNIWFVYPEHRHLPLQTLHEGSGFCNHTCVQQASLPGRCLDERRFTMGIVAVQVSDKTSAFLPTPHQELLLKACLFEGEDALAAWQAWRGGTNLDLIDIGSIRLLPLLADKLQRLGVKDSAFGKYRGVQRRTWARNQILFRAAGLALGRLGEAQIPAMALKGVVLASTYYETMALRPMGDFDLLVRRADGPRALDLLEGLGWRIWRVPSGHWRPRTPIEFAVQPASTLEDPANPEVQVDLHWRLLWGRFSEEAETALWERAIRFEIGGAQGLAPCAADMLVHVCAHGARWNVTPPVRWVIDAAFLVRSGAVDWAHFCVQTERQGLALPVTETLKYLRTVMRVAVPETVIQNLTRSRVKSIERLLYESESQPPAQRSLLTWLRIHQHIAWHEVARDQGLSGYWRYWAARRRGRSLPELTSWIRRRLGRGVNS